mgnify:CR=1 FL=1
MSLFDKFSLKTKKVKIKALDGKEVTIQELTIAQANEFYKRIVKGFGADGKAEINYSELGDIKIEKVAIGLVEPKISFSELKSLSNQAMPAIDEIAEAIDGFEAELKK